MDIPKQKLRLWSFPKIYKAITFKYASELKSQNKLNI